MSSRKCPDCLNLINICRELGACGRPAKNSIERKDQAAAQERQRNAGTHSRKQAVSE